MILSDIYIYIYITQVEPLSLSVRVCIGMPLFSFSATSVK